MPIRFGIVTLFGAALASPQPDFDDETGLLQSNNSWFFGEERSEHAKESSLVETDVESTFWGRRRRAPPPPLELDSRMHDVEHCDEELRGHRDVGYIGCQDHTVKGETCQKWVSQSPNVHTRTPSGYPNKGLGNHNFCRNPDGEPNIWCYTAHSMWERWNFCEPRKEVCDETYRHQHAEHWQTGYVHANNGAGYRGCKDVTVTGKRCMMWDAQYPHTHTREQVRYPGFGLGHHNHCRNPDGEPTIWCYTEDPDVRWDFCDHCNNGYSGDDCSIPPACSSAEHCNGHVTLDQDRTDGCVCQCANGWSGSDCTIPPPCDAATDCHGHGTTTDMDKTDGCHCQCTDGFTGGVCATPPPCNAAHHCSGHGTTGDKDASNGCDCTCSGGFRGADCSIPPACSSEHHCNGHATLDMDSTDGCVCHCSDGWSGDDCTIAPVCDSAKDCNGHGTTTDMDKTDGCMCTCTGGFSGDDCSVPKMCCRAMTADCLACMADLPAVEFCTLNPSVAGCELHLPPPPKKPCCQSMQVECLACQAGLSKEKYCEIYPGVEGCVEGEIIGGC